MLYRVMSSEGTCYVESDSISKAVELWKSATFARNKNEPAPDPDAIECVSYRKSPMIYRSSSKGEVEIAEMATPWLANSWRKLGGDSLLDKDADTLVLRSAMFNELISRGCAYDADTGQWTFPEKEATP